MSQLPEEIEAMAWIYGQSQAIDSMMTERNSQLVTDSNTIKRQISEYQKHSRGNPPQPQAPHIPMPVPSVVNPPIPQVENNIEPHFEYLPQPITQSGDVQLEFNMEPTKMDDMINILKEINIKLGKILNNQNESKNKTEKEPITKLPKGFK